MQMNGTSKKNARRSSAGLRTNLIDQAVYVDSPIVSALYQIEPFYRSGIFSKQSTPLLLQMKPAIRVQMLAARPPAGIDLRKVRRGQVSRIPIASNGIIFYPFNSQSNMNAVTNRNAFHVLTLHGESNKLASSRPAARLYDYICVAGPLALHRYLDSAIFTPADVEQGRLVMMGDSFVQDLPWIRPAKPDEKGALLYCPTWEGYGNGPVNYSTVHDKQGFSILSDVAHGSGTDQIIIKPHPYLGLLKPRLLLDFVSGVRDLVAKGLSVHLALSDSSLPLKALCRARLFDVKRISEDADSAVPVRLGLCDVSGMEAVFLKQKISNMIINPTGGFPPTLREIYNHKALQPQTKRIIQTVRNYLDDSQDIDDEHRALVFGLQVPELAGMTPDARRNWLIDYVRSDPFWGRTPEAANGVSI
jgi:hypothetical protein